MIFSIGTAEAYMTYTGRSAYLQLYAQCSCIAYAMLCYYNILWFCQCLHLLEKVTSYIRLPVYSITKINKYFASSGRQLITEQRIENFWNAIKIKKTKKKKKMV